MQPLDYKNIGGEEHLTFDSIRKLVLHELSELSEREAKKHMEHCMRCRDIYQSLASPNEVRQSFSDNRTVKPMVVGLLSVVGLIGAAASILYFGSESKPVEETTTEAPVPYSGNQDFEEVQESNEEAVAPVIEAIDTLAQISEEPAVESPLPTNKQFDQYIEKEQNQPRIKLWGIYGKITADGQPLPGVTVRVPGSNSGKMTDEGGKYYIQVPRNTKSLVFIYQGQQFVKNLDPVSRRLDIYFRSEENQDPKTPANIES